MPIRSLETLPYNPLSTIIDFSGHKAARALSKTSTSLRALYQGVISDASTFQAHFSGAPFDPFSSVHAQYQRRFSILSSRLRPVCSYTLKGHMNRVTSVAFGPDGTTVISGSDDKTLKLWRITRNSPICLNTLIGHTDWVESVAISPNGTRAISASDDNTLMLWELTTIPPTSLYTLTGHTHWITALAFSPDGTKIISTSSDGTFKLWDLTASPPTCLLTESISLAYSVAFSPDGTKVIFGSRDHIIELWDLTTTPPSLLHILRGHTDWVEGVAISPDGTRAVSASDDQTLKVWDMTTTPPTCRCTLTGHTNYVRSVAFSPNGTRIVSGSHDETLILWDFTTMPPTRLNILRGHTNPIRSVAFNNDGTLVISASEDRTLKLWSLYPTPENRIQDIAKKCLENDEKVLRKNFGSFQPQVRSVICKLLHAILMQTGSLPSIRPKNYAELVFQGNVRCPHPNKQKSKALVLYSLVHLTLPTIEENFTTAALLGKEKTKKEESELLSKETRTKVLELPKSVRDKIYAALYQIHKKAKKLPANIPSNYGELAFANLKNYSSTDEEKAEAIKKVMQSLRRTYGLIVVSQSTPPETALVKKRITILSKAARRG